jgi:tetratricopeptide (TPR) repeat protein
MILFSGSLFGAFFDEAPSGGLGEKGQFYTDLGVYSSANIASVLLGMHTDFGTGLADLSAFYDIYSASSSLKFAFLQDSGLPSAFNMRVTKYISQPGWAYCPGLSFNFPFFSNVSHFTISASLRYSTVDFTGTSGEDTYYLNQGLSDYFYAGVEAFTSSDMPMIIHIGIAAAAIPRSNTTEIHYALIVSSDYGLLHLIPDKIPAQARIKDSDAAGKFQYLDKARQESKAGNFGIALQTLMEGLRVYPGDLELTLMAAATFSDSGDMTTAAQYYKKAVEISPDNKEALDGLKKSQKGPDK